MQAVSRRRLRDRSVTLVGRPVSRCACLCRVGPGRCVVRVAHTTANVLAASSCAASAAGCAAAEADETRYDEVFEAVRAAEPAGQADLFRELVRCPGM